MKSVIKMDNLGTGYDLLWGLVQVFLYGNDHFN